MRSVARHLDDAVGIDVQGHAAAHAAVRTDGADCVHAYVLPPTSGRQTCRTSGFWLRTSDLLQHGRAATAQQGASGRARCRRGRRRRGRSDAKKRCKRRSASRRIRTVCARSLQRLKLRRGAPRRDWVRIVNKDVQHGPRFHDFVEDGCPLARETGAVWHDGTVERCEVRRPVGRRTAPNETEMFN
jgi:hypothetical protein